MFDHRNHLVRAKLDGSQWPSERLHGQMSTAGQRSELRQTVVTHAENPQGLRVYRIRRRRLLTKSRDKDGGRLCGDKDPTDKRKTNSIVQKLERQVGRGSTIREPPVMCDAEFPFPHHCLLVAYLLSFILWCIQCPLNSTHWIGVVPKNERDKIPLNQVIS